MELTDKPSCEFDIVHAFVTMKAELETQSDTLKKAMGDDGILWISYPKGGPNEHTDLNRNILWAILKDYGLRPVAQIAIDDVWSALRFKKVA